MAAGFAGAGAAALVVPAATGVSVETSSTGSEGFKSLSITKPEGALYIESLYEDEKFQQRQIAALVASKVFYYLGELNDSLTYALGAGPLFDVSEDSEYVQTLVAKCVDEYILLSVKAAESQELEKAILDPRLVAIVERMLEKCMQDGKFQQAVGIALECRRLDKLEEASPEVRMLRQCYLIAYAYPRRL
jgi:hypothetical protein